MTFKDLKNMQGMTNGEIARASGVPQDTVAALSRGITSPGNMRLETALRLAKAFNLELEEFCDRLEVTY